ncbi:hypothetical protein I7I50_06790 [Histoplasma capsulatum G186AR]|uniref:Uncharacterized protein n=1 Tax=Ajellomyces capsulatus TaxID=5037 RepID=A0A8H7YZ15_AJECA|nr:hypothetical protein I7I52_10136 [Histoplasma capsulatum]QSS67647.1 hypothetical protein I7I50_06790 [Histoplasma capsulatum G186AR]
MVSIFFSFFPAIPRENSRRIYRRTRPLPSRPYPFPIKIKQIRNWDQRQRYKSQKTRRPRYPELRIHHPSKQWERTRKTTAQERIGTNCTSRNGRECIDQVIQGCLEDCEEPKAHGYCTDYLRDPGDVRWRRPAEDE